MKKFLPVFSALLAATILFSTAGCSSVYYAAYEKVGVYKRDLLKKRVVEARDDQKEAQVQFKDAFLEQAALVDADFFVGRVINTAATGG